MKIVALLTIRNEERYLDRCLTHLYQEGVDVCVIDNGSTDRSLDIARSFMGRNVIRIEDFPFHGAFELKPILQNEERLAGEIKADWFIHHDADEIRQAPAPFKTLAEGISEADKLSYNAINFDEFVFLPTDDQANYEGTDYVKSMRYYYFFEPETLRRINAWKNPGMPINLADSGGHGVTFDGQHVFPTPFILRHYPALSRAHAVAKYCGRVYAEKEAAQGWHGTRSCCSPDRLKFPGPSQLKELSEPNKWDRSDPWKTHTFLGEACYLSQEMTVSVREAEKEHIKAFPMEKFVFIRNLFAKRKSNIFPVPFIVGVGRSGSTLLRLMLDAHPELAIPPETHFIPVIASLKSDDPDLREHFFQAVVRHLHWPDFHLSKEVFRKHLDAVDPFTCSEGLRIFFRLYAKRLNKTRWGDKTPPYDRQMIAIKGLLPEARFIHIIRDGRDVALSHKGLWFGAGDSVEAQAAQWVWRIREARRHAQHLPHYLEVRYEKLVYEPERVLRTICDFIELPFSPKMLEYHETASDRLAEIESRLNDDGSVRLSKEKRLEIFQLTNRPPVKEQVQRWRREMSLEERSRFEAVAYNMLRDLGY